MRGGLDCNLECLPGGRPVPPQSTSPRASGGTDVPRAVLVSLPLRQSAGARRAETRLPEGDYNRVIGALGTTRRRCGCDTTAITS